MKSDKWPQGTARATAGAARRRAALGPVPLTVGIEEEYLLVDPVTRHLSAKADKVVALAGAELGDRVTTELTRYQVEIRTDPHTSLTDLGDQLSAARRAVAEAARRLGLRAVSSGTPVLGQHTPPPLTPGPRYARSSATFRALDHEQTACACHVHIGVPDLATALRLSNQLRCWLPALIALTANSPYWEAQDTGYASWRTLTRWRWPVAGPPPYLESPSHFEDLVGSLMATESVMDRGGLYWDIRPSHHVPTLEIRVADACHTVHDTLLLAAAVRGLAVHWLSGPGRDQRAQRPEPEVLRAACWRAARDGLAGHSLDLRTNRLETTASHLDRLWETVLPTLDAAESTLLRDARTRLDMGGNGADRQRRAYRERHRITDVVDHLIESATRAPAT
ncbi:glutamate--cysteine ligase [Streptomyces sp. NPDC015237]|uniref:carboxylate-amine ligase n=1 Tax=Streptomyces sp. NPDC015237 TaxID=3364949 RepID=UPI0036F58597